MTECERHQWIVHTGSGRVYCRNCDAKLGPLEVEERLNAVERLEPVAEATWRLVSSSPSDKEEGLYCVVCGTNILHVDALLKALAAAGYGEECDDGIHSEQGPV